MKSILKECLRLSFCAVAYMLGSGMFILLAVTFYFRVYLPIADYDLPVLPIIVIGVVLLIMLVLARAIRDFIKDVRNTDLSQPHDYYD